MKKLLLCLLLFAGVTISKVQAQLNPLTASYYQNQYIANPAMAGLDTALHINLTYRNQWNSIPGAPTSQALTGDYGFKKVGLGLNLYNDKSGLQRWTRVVGSYAYHLKLNNDEQHLHFGVSLGFSSERLDNSLINGSTDDVLIDAYNRRGTYIDGDAGAAYTSKRLTLQAALPNLKHLFKDNDPSSLADRATFFAAAAYKLSLSNSQDGMGLEPKVVFRGVKGLDNIVDAGANLTFINNKLNLLAIYHTTKSTTFGVGMQYQWININAAYTTETSALRRDANGTFEINLRLSVF
ncbi:PorP/SprF family type IX secretion system membrane protein [Pedobacter hartonius]|uniref:Type IX secretion system membrane protein, PorP/SprF family n=1 Tax=Pedobacter hartonius TaxID=425514 RepID=A0A1H3XEE3_9SPHI|nr:PorP/SprF family type IX secretion system membrane protein [Pedobacter hartonius]SDZ97703.1 type IX secretion system membrane protein, PorP/SprF family [Pedobacter hartonius]